VNAFDHTLLLYLNHVADQSPVFTKIVVGIVVAGLAGGLLCIVVVRIVAAALPFRVRPISNDAIGLHFPIAPEGWANWSAFPSDNAALFFCLTMCLFSISRVLGTLALLDTALLIVFPRVFVGVHHVAALVDRLYPGGIMNRRRISRAWFLVNVCGRLRPGFHLAAIKPIKPPPP